MKKELVMRNSQTRYTVKHFFLTIKHLAFPWQTGGGAGALCLLAYNGTSSGSSTSSTANSSSSTGAALSAPPSSSTADELAGPNNAERRGEQLQDSSTTTCEDARDKPPKRLPSVLGGEEGISVLTGHSGGILDFQFCPFDDHMRCYILMPGSG